MGFEGRLAEWALLKRKGRILQRGTAAMARRKEEVSRLPIN